MTKWKRGCINTPMAINVNKKFRAIGAHQIGELTSIYDDFLYIARGHENFLHKNSAFDLANIQMSSLNTNRWDFEPTTDEETEDFHDFIENNNFKDEKRSYIILKHIKPENNRGYTKRFVVPPYEMTTANMQMPSKLERCSIIYPKDATLGDTVFYVDGLYKLTFNDAEFKDTRISDLFLKPGIFNELYMMINEAENIFSLEFSMDFESDVYADEMVALNENIILELVGVFAEKLVSICRYMYNVTENHRAIELAQRDGLIQSADAFKEYMNIRNFIRHQWDTLDELGYFSAEKSDYIKNKRAARMESYLKLCDQTRNGRMKSYIEILRQMQYVIDQINPNRIVRYDTETNHDFITRLKVANKINPTFQVELNMPQYDTRYIDLDKAIHKLFPKMRVADYYLNQPNRQSRIDEYKTRSYYLQTFLGIECMIMRHCILRGMDMENKSAWEYAEEIGLLTPAEADKWQKYNALRNWLSHNYFSKNLRELLFAINNEYEKDLRKLADKLIQHGPEVHKVQNGVYGYNHDDGLDVVLDYNKHEIVSRKFLNTPIHERYNGGVEYNTSKREIIDVKLPNGIRVDLNTKTVYWDDKTDWDFETLYTEKSKIVTNKNLRVTEYTELNSHMPFGRNEKTLIDYRHSLTLDSFGKIKELKFKKQDGEFLRARFASDTKGIMVVFPDKTIIYQSGPRIKIYHNGTILNFNNRREFANTYAAPQNMALQTIPAAKVR